MIPPNVCEDFAKKLAPNKRPGGLASLSKQTFIALILHIIFHDLRTSYVIGIKNGSPYVTGTSSFQRIYLQ